MTDNAPSPAHPLPDEIDVDCRHLSCPLPVLRLQKALSERAVGARLTMVATDPVSVIDIPHFCSEHGHLLARHTTHRSAREDDVHFFEIVKGDGAAD